MVDSVLQVFFTEMLEIILILTLRLSLGRLTTGCSADEICEVVGIPPTCWAAVPSPVTIVLNLYLSRVSTVRIVYKLSFLLFSSMSFFSAILCFHLKSLESVRL